MPSSSRHKPHSEPLLQDALPGLPEEDIESPTLIGSESIEWSVIPDLDKFLRNLYLYHKDKGLATILTGRLLNQIATLAFLIAFSAVLLLCINWHALGKSDGCLARGTCDIWDAAVYKRPLSDHSLPWVVFCLAFLAVFSLYLLWDVYNLLAYLPDLLDVAHFTRAKLGVSERQVRSITWPEFVRRLVELQRGTRLCIQRDLSEHDIVSRIMRRDNYLIGMLNKGVLPLHVPLPLLRRRLMLTKTLEWSLRRCVFDHMFDPATFRVRPDFLQRPDLLRRRFVVEAAVMLALSPFVLCFLLLYFFMRNAEKFYNHPASIGARRWSLLARWRMREFNELEHYIHHRLNAAHKAAEKYVGQFPNPLLSHVARFVAFVTGSFVALLLAVTLLDEVLLERPLWGRHLVWWLATLGIVLAVSRTFVVEPGVAFDPELAMLEVAAHTHHLPRHWRGRAHTREVQGAFGEMFQYKGALFLEEVASVLLTPFVLALSMPRAADAIIGFVRDFTTHVDGVGDVCSLAAFDFERHGNSRYGSPVDCPRAQRSRQGKMEKSFLSFVATYPTWQPPEQGAQEMLASISRQQQHDGASMIVSSAGIGGRYVHLAGGQELAASGGWATALAHTLQRNPAMGGGGGGAFGAGWLSGAGAHAAGPSPTASIFASADLGALGGAAAAAASMADSDCEARVAVGHAALQSLYAERSRAARHARPQQHQQQQHQQVPVRQRAAPSVGGRRDLDDGSAHASWLKQGPFQAGRVPAPTAAPPASLWAHASARDAGATLGSLGSQGSQPRPHSSGSAGGDGNYVPPPSQLAPPPGAEAELPAWVSRQEDGRDQEEPQWPTDTFGRGIPIAGRSTAAPSGAMLPLPPPPLRARSWQDNSSAMASQAGGVGSRSSRNSPRPAPQPAPGSSSSSAPPGSSSGRNPPLGSLAELRRKGSGGAAWGSAVAVPPPPAEQGAEMSVLLPQLQQPGVTREGGSSPPPGFDDFM